MNNKRASVFGIFTIITLSLLILKYTDVDFDKISLLYHAKTAENQIRRENNKIKKIVEFDIFEGINQCIWGTWIITEVWYGHSCHEEDELKNTIIRILPQSFSFGKKTSTELVGYHEELIAIKDNGKDYYYIETFQNLGLNGDYYLLFHPKWDDYEKDIFPLVHFVLVSETEMMVPIGGHDRCILQKIENYNANESDIPLMAGDFTFRSTCYGKWLITERITTEKVTKDKMLKNDSHIGQIVTVKGERFASCRVFGRSEKRIDEIAVQIGLSSENKYLICYEFQEDFFWDQMICVDDMTAVLVKENNLFLVKRISDPAEDYIYDEIG